MIAKSLLKRKLIACANMFPINSMYYWKKKLVNDKEHVLLVKTKNNKAKQVQKEIEKLHSYNTPAILSWKFNTNKKFKKWMNKEVK